MVVLRFVDFARPEICFLFSRVDDLRHLLMLPCKGVVRHETSLVMPGQLLLELFEQGMGREGKQLQCSLRLLDCPSAGDPQ